MTGKGIENEKWMLRWSSECGHVTGKEELVACQLVPVEEKGVTVGMIEPAGMASLRVHRTGKHQL